jgi:uncharacterized membrane protein YccC
MIGDQEEDHVPSLIPPRGPADARLVRLASRLAIAAMVALLFVVLLGIEGWKGLTAFAFVVALVLAVGAGAVFAIAALLPRRP